MRQRHVRQVAGCGRFRSKELQGCNYVLCSARTQRKIVTQHALLLLFYFLPSSFFFSSFSSSSLSLSLSLSLCLFLANLFMKCEYKRLTKWINKKSRKRFSFLFCYYSLFVINSQRVTVTIEGEGKREGKGRGN